MNKPLEGLTTYAFELELADLTAEEILERNPQDRAGEGR